MEITKPPAPLCFVLMPFGRKTEAVGRVTNFNSVYRQLIAPAVVGAGLEPIRADEEKVGESQTRKARELAPADSKGPRA